MRARVRVRVSLDSSWAKAMRLAPQHGNGVGAGAFEWGRAWV